MGMTAPSRQFELLVARIEGVLVPDGAVVKSPDRLRDLITGEMREVDVSIRSKVGSVEVLITVECRDRVATQDVTWIEQLATKQKQIGATHTIAVSSTGFSEPALTAAHFHGISTRSIEAVTDAEIRAWAEELQVYGTETTWKLGPMRATFFENSQESATLDSASSQSLNDRGWDAEIFLEIPSGRSVSLAELTARLLDSERLSRQLADGARITIPPKTTAVISSHPLAALIGDIPHDGTEARKKIRLEFERGAIGAHTTAGLLNIHELTFEMSFVSSRKNVVQAPRLLEYADGTVPLGHVAERQVQIGPSGQGIVITWYRAAPQADGTEKKK